MKPYIAKLTDIRQDSKVIRFVPKVMKSGLGIRKHDESKANCVMISFRVWIGMYFSQTFYFCNFFFYFVCFPQIYTYFKKIIFCQKTTFHDQKFLAKFCGKKG